MTMKSAAIVLLSLIVGACATAPTPQEADRLFNDRLFAAPSVRIDGADVFAVSPEMKRYLESDVARLVRLRGRQRGLFEALYDRGQLKLEYDAAKTRNASEAFAARE